MKKILHGFQNRPPQSLRLSPLAPSPIKCDNDFKCWGDGSFGMHGQGHIANIGSTVDEIANLDPIELKTGKNPLNGSIGSYHVYSLLNDLEIKCWGYNEFGQLGYNDVITRGDEPGEMGDNLPNVDLGL